MTITLTIPDAQMPKLINALCIRYGYQETIVQEVDGILQTIDNPQTKAQFARESIINHLKQVVRDTEYEEARRNIVVSDVDVT